MENEKPLSQERNKGKKVQWENRYFGNGQTLWKTVSDGQPAAAITVEINT
jgi:hypothetical protein